MLNFNYYNPVQVVFGKGEIASLSKLIESDKKVLITAGGGSIKKNGVYDSVVKALKGKTYFEFWGIEPNPSYETLMKAVEIVKKEKIDFLLACGGGSVIDGTKFIAAASLFEGEPWDILSKGAPVTRAIPIGTVLTLPATGSEMNVNSVISRNSTGDKLVFGSVHVMPKFSILDPEATYSLPVRQIRNGIVDSYVHVMEQYLTYPVNSPLQDRLSESILLTLIEEGPKTLQNPTDYDARANLMWCSTLALNGLIAQGVPQDWATHMIGHEVTALKGLDHAQTLAVILPSVMKVMSKNKKDKLLQYASRIFKIGTGTDEERIERAIDETLKFFKSLGIAVSFSDYKLTVDIADAVTANLTRHKLTALGEKQDVTPDKVREIISLCFR